MIQEFGITRGFYDELMDCDVEGAYSGNPRWPNGFSLHTPGNAGYGRKGGAFPPTRKPGDMIGMEVTDLSLCLFVTCLIPSMRWANGPHPSPASSLHGPEVGQPASLREFIISAQRSLFSGMLDIHTEGFFIIGLGWPLPPVCTLKPEAGLWRQVIGDPAVPERTCTHPGSYFPIPGSRPAILPAFRVHGTCQHLSNKFLLLASAGLSKQLLLTTQSPLNRDSLCCTALTQMARWS